MVPLFGLLISILPIPFGPQYHHPLRAVRKTTIPSLKSTALSGSFPCHLASHPFCLQLVSSSFLYMSKLASVLTKLFRSTRSILLRPDYTLQKSLHLLCANLFSPASYRIVSTPFDPCAPHLSQFAKWVAHRAPRIRRGRHEMKRLKPS